MTEAEWLACSDPTPMLQFLRGKASDRKLRLYAVACCRRVWRWMTDDRSRQAVEISEMYADGWVGQKKLNAARREAFAASKSPIPFPVSTHDPQTSAHAAIVALDACASSKTEEPWMIANATAGCARSLVFHAEGDATGWSEMAAQCHQLRHIIGNPFYPVTLDPAWLTSTVAQLAESIYQERAFDRLPILADALEDAGCRNADILNHCRQGGEHARGCWVVDLLLGKE